MSVHVVLSSDRDGHDYTAAELTALSAFHKKVDSIDLAGALEVFNILDEDGDGSITQADDAPPQAQVVEEMPPAPECAQPPPGYVVPPSPPPGYAQPPPGYAVPPQQATGRQVVTFQVPPGAPPGALCTFALADGRQVQVQIPPGAAPGMTFPCEV